MNNTRFPVSAIIVITVFYSFMIFLLFQVFKTGGKGFLFLMPGLFLMLYTYSMEKEWNPMYKAPNFLAIDGTIGVVEETPRPIHGNRVVISISTKKEYLPKEQWYRMGGVKALFAHLAGKVQFDIIDSRDKIIQITGENLGAKEGAFLYLGSLGKRPVLDIFGDLQKKLDDAQAIIRNQESVYERAKQVANALGRENNMNMVDVSQHLGVILRDWGDAFKPMNVNKEGNK